MSSSHHRQIHLMRFLSVVLLFCSSTCMYHLFCSSFIEPPLSSIPLLKHYLRSGPARTHRHAPDLSRTSHNARALQSGWQYHGPFIPSVNTQLATATLEKRAVNHYTDSPETANRVFCKRTNEPGTNNCDPESASPRSPKASFPDRAQWTDEERTWTHLRVRNLAERVWKGARLQQLTDDHFAEFLAHASSAHATQRGAKYRRTGQSEKPRFETIASSHWASTFSYSGGQDKHAVFMLAAEWVAEKAGPKDIPRPTNREITDLHNWIQRTRRRVPAAQIRERIKDLAKRAYAVLQLSRFH